MEPLHICISENRAAEEIGVKLLVLSLAKHEPTAIIHAFVDDLSGDLRDWLGTFPNVRQEHLAIDPALGWNIKPKTLLNLLEGGLSSVIWIDTDIILTGPIHPFFSSLGAETFVTAEEFYTISNQGVLTRTRGWGLPPGRELPFTPNSSVLRVTQQHVAFLKAWQELLDRPDYRTLQAGPWQKRPFYMMGDQEVMSALLGSAPFAAMEVQPIRRGRDIAQCFGPDGYSPWERLRNGRRNPPLIHAQGGKPWRLSAASQTYQYVSPYWYAAQAYRHSLHPEERHWLDKRPATAKLLHHVAFGSPNMAGFLPALFHLVGKRLRAVGSIIRRKMSGG